ncbi:ankyrin repeat domain-containing protein [Tamlana sp. 2_MG-2023]|uniref:ankyrin repeat domain-containing protein n=1 Tax=unclassified Tamlana TaxID=2614803 RepID=UPI0026E3E12E|nr:MULTISPECIES: ankyrin repeat domain-containing protein [unclassified Tamlana]MDO6760319.1 ankyrin repeat domain-containing protein [Tamlana sp. 2_MG-2023]MDO6789983.1 ankyrin repeat domain-containing protein [Tamlana sp. 1_MG-2023]
MKKTIIISTMALCFSIANVNASPEPIAIKTNKVEAYFKVNSFCVSIAKGDYETVSKLIERGADVNAKSNGMTPAMYAAKYNRTEILQLLIVNGANLKTKCSKGKTAADYAELHGAVDAKVIIDDHFEATKMRK